MTGHALLRSVLFLLLCLGNEPDSRITHTKDLLNTWPNRKLLIHGIHADLCGGSTEFVPEGNHVTPVRSIATTDKRPNDSHNGENNKTKEAFGSPRPLLWFQVSGFRFINLPHKITEYIEINY